ncbi:hypothetical protein [Ilumatobacter sp.]
MILNCDRIWTRLVSAVFTLRRRPRVTNDPPRLSTVRSPRRRVDTSVRSS